MNSLLLRIAAITLLVFALSALGVVVVGQTRGASASVPCVEDSVPGRPTLKRRQVTPDDSRVPENNNPQKNDDRAPCLPLEQSLNSREQDSLTVRFEGLHAFSEADVLNRVRPARIAWPRGRMPDRDLIEKARAVLKELFQSHGYEQVTVDATSDVLSQTVTFVIDEGPRLQIAEIRFEGNRIFSAPELAARMREYLDKYESSRTGYDAEILEYCRHSLANFVRSFGYLQAQFGEPKKEVNGLGLVITMHVNEGILYRIGEISIGGARAISVQHVRTMLSLQAGDIANGEALSKWLFEDVKRSYGEIGYIQYSAEVTPHFGQNSSGGLVNLEVGIDEGSPFKVRKIEFVGTNLQQYELRRLLLITDGGVYNQSLFEDSVKKLNETGWFEFVDKDKDADFRTNDEEGLLDVAIKLTRKNDRTP